MRSLVRCVVSLAAVAAAGFALDLTTFRQSYSRASRADWSVSLGAGVRDQTGYQASQDADLYGSLYWKTSILSDDLDLDAEVSASASGRRQSGGLPDTMAADRQEWSAGLSLYPDAMCHAYPFHSDAFIRSAVRIWSDADVSEGCTGSQRGRAVVLDADLWGGELGVGYGRMRDAAPLLKAVRLTRILREDGVLQRELTDDDLRDLGGFLSRAWKLFYAHDRAAKFYYDSLEQWLLRAGAIQGPLPAYTLFRLDETPLIGTDTRRFGWRGFLTANFDVHGRKEWHERTDTAWTELDTSSNRSYRVGWEFSRPVGMRWMYGASVAYVLPWPRQRDMDTQHQFLLGGSASYDMTDHLVASYVLDITPVYTPAPKPYYNNHLSLPSTHELVFSYYISERFAVRLGGRYETSFDSYANRYQHHTDFAHRWVAALTMTFGRIPEGWGVHYYL